MSQPDYPGAIWMPVPSDIVFTGAQPRFAIVIHKTACNAQCTAQDVANFFIGMSNPDHPSTHFIVGRDGAVVQCVSLEDGAGGNCCTKPGFDPFWNSYFASGRNINLDTISIEHCDWTSNNSQDCTPEQLAASFNLVKWLCTTYNIPATHIKTHASIDPVDKANCPGNYPMANLIAFVAGVPAPSPLPPSPPTAPIVDVAGVPQGWTETNYQGDPRLVAPNGGVLRGAFRLFVLSDPEWNPTDMPEFGEETVSVLEESNPARGGGVRQVCTFSTLEMLTNQGNKVEKGWTGQELLFVRADRDNLRTLYTQLQSKITQLQAGMPKADIQNAIAAMSKLSQDLGNFIQ